MGHEKHINNDKNQCMSTDKLKTDYPCDLKRWLMNFLNIIIPLMKKIRYKRLNVILNLSYIIESEINFYFF